MNSNIILYTTNAGSVSVQVQYEDGTFWLTQKRMAELFGVEVPTIHYHLKEIFQTGELQENRTIRKIRIVQMEGNAMLNVNWIFVKSAQVSDVFIKKLPTFIH